MGHRLENIFSLLPPSKQVNWAQDFPTIPL